MFPGQPALLNGIFPAKKQAAGPEGVPGLGFHRPEFWVFVQNLGWLGS